MAGNGSSSVPNRKGKELSRYSEEQMMSLSSDESFIPTAAEDADMCNQSRSSGSASPSGTKRSRTHYTPKQICILEGKFAQNEFPSAEERATMATELDVKIQHIQVWFQNRRAKHRRKKRKAKVEDTAVRTPKPPAFWPQYLPFDSNFTSCPGNKKNASNSSDVSMVSSPASSQSTPLSSPALRTTLDTSDTDLVTRLPKLTTASLSSDTNAVGTCQEQLRGTSHDTSLLQSPQFLPTSRNPTSSSASVVPEENLPPTLGCSMLPDLGDDSLEAFLRQADFAASNLGEGSLYLGSGEDWDAGVLSSFDTETHLNSAAQLYPPSFQTHPTSSSQAYQQHHMFSSTLPLQGTWPQGPVTYLSYPYDPHHPVTTSAP
eukprot:Em0001g25a